MCCTISLVDSSKVFSSGSKIRSSSVYIRYNLGANNHVRSSRLAQVTLLVTIQYILWIQVENMISLVHSVVCQSVHNAQDILQCQAARVCIHKRIKVYLIKANTWQAREC